jgi:hypothetical protein
VRSGHRSRSASRPTLPDAMRGSHHQDSGRGGTVSGPESGAKWIACAIIRTGRPSAFGRQEARHTGLWPDQPGRNENDRRRASLVPGTALAFQAWFAAAGAAGRPEENWDPPLWFAMRDPQWKELRCAPGIKATTRCGRPYWNIPCATLCSAANGLSFFVARATETDLKSFAEEHLFRPLNVEAGDWIQDWEGYYHGHADLHLTARDMAKFGLPSNVFGGRLALPSGAQLQRNGVWLSVVVR